MHLPRSILLIGLLASNCFLFSNSVIAKQNTIHNQSIRSLNGKSISVKQLVSAMKAGAGDFDQLDFIVRTPADGVRQIAWVFETCEFTSDPVWQEKYGPFQEMDKERSERHRRFELRLYLRRLSANFANFYRPTNSDDAQEKSIIHDAEKYGYVTKSTFPIFALSCKIMGQKKYLKIKALLAHNKPKLNS